MTTILQPLQMLQLLGLRFFAAIGTIGGIGAIALSQALSVLVAVAPTARVTRPRDWDQLSYFTGL